MSGDTELFENPSNIKDLWVSGQKTREPLNKSLYPVSTQCISRHLRLVKVISVQNSHYLSA
ncbi:hypothetical protein, partial [Intestinimonas sp. HCP28S3_D6]|uniref:hypothetical protein n=1 Tax=Intestinimonas sp. HCP28S3_D6 TaxID=3438942 RepID=UPI003F898ED5